MNVSNAKLFVSVLIFYSRKALAVRFLFSRFNYPINHIFLYRSCSSYPELKKNTIIIIFFCSLLFSINQKQGFFFWFFFLISKWFVRPTQRTFGFRKETGITREEASVITSPAAHPLTSIYDIHRSATLFSPLGLSTGLVYCISFFCEKPFQ